MVTGLVERTKALQISSCVENPPAGVLKRFAGNPILEPIPEHSWESRYVLNAAAIKLGYKTYMLYRAFGEDGVSRIGLAVTEDGFNFTERLERPIFEPKDKSEEKGCEDPRVTLIGGRIYMTYISYDGVIAQIALASISVRDFLNYRWERWRRHGLFRPGCKDKDAAVFPELFNGMFGMLHRIDPDIRITFSHSLNCPWPYDEDMILARPTDGKGWDAKKIGIGTQPIKTEYGWLLITHGVDHDRVYRLGVMLLDLFDPSVLTYRSPNFILEPIHPYEIGEDGKSWVPNVVFTCGAVSRDEGVLGDDDELIVYYGGADSLINGATAKVGELIPDIFKN